MIKYVTGWYSTTVFYNLAGKGSLFYNFLDLNRLNYRGHINIWLFSAFSWSGARNGHHPLTCTAELCTGSAWPSSWPCHGRSAWRSPPPPPSAPPKWRALSSPHEPLPVPRNWSRWGSGQGCKGASGFLCSWRWCGLQTWNEGTQAHQLCNTALKWKNFFHLLHWHS